MNPRRLALLIPFLLASCGKTPDYLHLITPQPVRASYDGTHKIKELQGASQADILWVIDNSGSMGNWQRDVQRNAGLFMQGFAKKASFDWKMGVISTSTDESPYIGFGTDLLNRANPDPVVAFERAVSRLGINGDTTEKTFEPVTRAFTDHPDFNRKNAVLVLIIVTDAPEQSRTSPKDFLAFLGATKGDVKRVYTYGIFGPQDWGCEQTDDFWNYKGSRYEELVLGTNGKTYKLCDPDFGKNLGDLGQDIGRRVSSPLLPLQSRPALGTLQVFYKGRELPGGPRDQGGLWMYDFDRNALVFYDLDFAPGDDEEVRVVYQVDDGLPR